VTSGWRAKWNVWVQRCGATALALMAYVKLPTNQDNLGNHSVEGGSIVRLQSNSGRLECGLE